MLVVEEVGKELWVFDTLQIRTDPIIKVENWKGYSRDFIEDEIEMWYGFLQVGAPTKRIDIGEIQKNMERYSGLSVIYKDFLEGIDLDSPLSCRLHMGI